MFVTTEFLRQRYVHVSDSSSPDFWTIRAFPCWTLVWTTDPDMPDHQVRCRRDTLTKARLCGVRLTDMPCRAAGAPNRAAYPYPSADERNTVSGEVGDLNFQQKGGEPDLGEAPTVKRESRRGTIGIHFFLLLLGDLDP